MYLCERVCHLFDISSLRDFVVVGLSVLPIFNPYGIVNYFLIIHRLQPKYFFYSPPDDNWKIKLRVSWTISRTKTQYPINSHVEYPGFNIQELITYIHPLRENSIKMITISHFKKEFPKRFIIVFLKRKRAKFVKKKR